MIAVPDAGGCHQSADAAVSIDDGGVDPQCTASAPVVSFATDVMPILRACTGEICHAWSYDENGETQYVTVLEIPPVDSPSSAVTIAIAAKARNQ